MWFLLAMFGCGAAPVEVAVSSRTVDTVALKAALADGKVPVLFDVRTPEEYAVGHVPGAKNLPVQQLGERVTEVEPYREGEVWLICESGGRSAKAAAELSARGFTTVDVSDGTSGWRAAGYPTE